MKKKISGILLSMLLAFSITACGNSNSEVSDRTTQSSKESTEESSNDTTQKEGEKALIAYFTFPETDGTDVNSGASRRVVDGEVVGSTQVIAQMIQESVGGDLFAIETVQKYPGTHEPLVDQASGELEENARPELSSKVDNMDDYDTVYIGYPNWWGDMPMPLYTFLEEYDLSDKTIIPFTTHGGSSLSDTVQSIADAEPEANVIEDAFSISRDEDLTAAQSTVDTWLEQIGMQ